MIMFLNMYTAGTFLGRSFIKASRVTFFLYEVRDQGRDMGIQFFGWGISDRRGDFRKFGHETSHLTVPPQPTTEMGMFSN